MKSGKKFKAALLASVCAVTFAPAARGASFNIPSGDLKAALDAYMKQSGITLMYAPDAVRGIRSNGIRGNLPNDEALSHILKGTGLSEYRTEAGEVGIVRGQSSMRKQIDISPLQLAQATPVRAAVETVTVTSSKLGGADVQSIPIAITALSQEQLTSRQIAGGPDLVKEVPNLTFSKTNFTGYNIQIRGIGTQAISVTTDPAVAVAFNDTPFIRNHFFEQEFYDVAQAEVLRGPQGTLYGRNATAGVVNIVSAKPTDQFEAMASADIGNYKNRRFEGMINLPISADKLDLRIAGEWTKRDGYSFNTVTDQPIDGRDLWSSRVSLSWKPTSDFQAYLIWEHFSENDDRLRSGKQLCHTDPGQSTFISNDGQTVNVPNAQGTIFTVSNAYFSQGCLPDGLYNRGNPGTGDYGSYGVPNGFSLPFISGAAYLGYINTNIDPYTKPYQSTNLREIESAINPLYRAKNDTLELNTSWNVTPALTLYSDTGYNNDFLWSTEDYNRFTTSPGIFVPNAPLNDFPPHPIIGPDGTFCDPQLGCSDRLVVQDLSTERAWQLSQEFRLASNFAGPLNFSAGGSYLHYETWENYYVFSNTFTMIALENICLTPGLQMTVQDSIHCLKNQRGYVPRQLKDLTSTPTESPQYIDPHPITALDNEGHNYFVSQNPYNLNSYAAFGEAYYDVTPELKLTAGLRWTDDKKHFTSIPSELLVVGYGYPESGVVDQAWRKFTGRFVANWSPKLNFTDQSMFYASYARGYKAGGANPPGPILVNADTTPPDRTTTVNTNFPVHPLTFKPEFVNAFELGTKNALMDGGLTLNGDIFYYDYKGYQISKIVDRTAINDNFDATVKGAEIEATYEPLPGLKFSFAGGYEHTRLANNQYSIDLMDRTAGHDGWVLMKPSVGQASNCIFPDYVAAALTVYGALGGQGNQATFACGSAYGGSELDPLTLHTYQYGLDNGLYPKAVPDVPLPGFPTIAYSGYDPATAPNNGEGFAKPLAGNELPNAPHFTISLTADYTVPISPDWAATLHADYYWQSDSWARVFNDNPYDRIHGYSNVNLALILADASGWQAMAYVKNLFDVTAITGDFLNSDDSGLTTNIFLTDPRLFGVRVTKHFGDGETFDIFPNNGGKAPQVWLQLGGMYDANLNAGKEAYAPPFSALMPLELPTPQSLQRAPASGFDWEGKLTIQSDDSDWKLMAAVRYGRSNRNNSFHKSLVEYRTEFPGYFSTASKFPCSNLPVPSQHVCTQPAARRFIDAQEHDDETHAIMDFDVGKDIGIGAFGGQSKSTLSFGIRVAHFKSATTGLFNSDPNYNPYDPFFVANGDIFNVQMEETRSFNGVGPQIAWDAQQPVWGTPDQGELTVDVGINAAVLFGRQKADGHHETSQCHFAVPFFSALPCSPVPSGTHAGGFSRSRNVTVPNLGGYLGLSMNYPDAKINFGYRADTFFNAIDGGQDTAKSYNRGFYGPYLNISFGLGG